MGDKQLRQDILDELEYEPSIDAAHIGDAVDHGVVTLAGHVSSSLEKLAVERAVKRLKGVRAIAEEIEVRLPYEQNGNSDSSRPRTAERSTFTRTAYSMAHFPASRLALTSAFSKRWVREDRRQAPCGSSGNMECGEERLSRFAVFWLSDRTCG